MLAAHIQIMKPASTTKAIDGIWLLRLLQTTREDLRPVERQALLAPPADLVEADRHERPDQREGEGEEHDPERLVDRPERQEDRDPGERVDAAEEQPEARRGAEVGPAGGSAP